MGFRVAIPARYAASRLPGKPLREIHGRPLLEYVYRQALASGADEVVVATDDERVRIASEGFGATVVMTSPDHSTGTDRLAETARKLRWDDDQVVVNLQGDEPLMPPALIRRVAEDLERLPEVGISTVATPIDHRQEVLDPNVVKVVLSDDNRALYFSRAAIPHCRDGLPGDGELGGLYLRHLGLYAYRVSVLHRYPRLSPSEAERYECLEQLRALHHGIAIHVHVTGQLPPAGVDTEADLVRVTELLRSPGAPTDPQAGG